MIHICYAIQDQKGTYCKFLATSILSVLQHTKQHVHFHILCDDTLTDGDCHELAFMVKSHSQHISFYNMKLLMGTQLQMFRELLPKNILQRFSEAAMYRLLAFEVLPVNVARLIYLDVDTYINEDVGDLWEVDIRGFALGAVADQAVIQLKEKYQVDRGWKIVPHQYFNSGVLLMARAGWETAGQDFLCLAQKLFGQYPELANLPDQNLLNEYFENKWYALPAQYNRLVAAEKDRGDCRAEYGIVHYSSTLTFNLQDSFSKKFWHYFCQTPWWDETLFFKMASIINEISDKASQQVDWNRTIKDL